MSESCAIRATRLSHAYEENTPAIVDIDLDVRHGAFLAVVGRNGSGKTTLVKHFNGLLKPTGGHVFIYGVDTRHASVNQMAQRVGYVFQNPDHQIFCATTREEISFGPRNLGLDSSQVRERTEQALAQFHLEPYADLPPAVLGYGLRRQISIAAVLAMRPRCLILDEPTAGLDRRSAVSLLRAICGFHEAGNTAILVSHDMRLVAEYVPEMLIMEAGQILAYGPTREVFGMTELLACAQLRPTQVMELGRCMSDLGLPRDALTVREFCRAYVDKRERPG